MGRVVRAGAVAAVLAVALAGCGAIGGGDDGEGKASGPGGQAAGPAAVADVNKVIVKQTFDSPIAPGAKLDIAINELKVSGRLAYLTMTLTPRNTQAQNPGPNLYALNGQAGVDISLIDTVNLKRYVVVKDSQGKELGPDDIFVRLTDGQPTQQTYTYAAPPESVKALDVSIGQWAPFRNVPVSR